MSYITQILKLTSNVLKTDLIDHELISEYITRTSDAESPFIIKHLRMAI